MTRGSAQTAPASQPAPAAGTDTDSWAAIRGDSDIQFTPIETPPPAERPDWLTDILEFFSALFRPVGEVFGSGWPVVKWVLIAAAAAMVLYILYRLLAPVLALRPQRDVALPEWVPEEGQARALLEEADALAAQGHYDEAAHLLLIRSVAHISEARPDWVEPSSTARELASLTALPDVARTAFATIAERVERSLFALRPLDRQDWQVARDAYASFALQNLRAAHREHPA